MSFVGDIINNLQVKFKLAKRFHIQGIPFYKVKDFNQEAIERDFYDNDLQKN